jgi:GT2 family glycosyltransferase
MQVDQVPPVVAVVVTNDPGPWLEECLESLVAQDYPACAILVVDEASTTNLACRVAAVAPNAYLLRSEENRGYGAGANEVLGAVDGAAFFLFCHDDVVLRPHALHVLVEAAFRLNAGIVGPKLVDRADPDRILQLGLGVDRLGAPVRRIERGEVDQAQHDEVAEVFAVPGGCTLVRADLFAAIGGFDPEISLLGEDVDLCWRARLAGARVVVAPGAVAAHLEATASRRRPCPEARALQWRHELRVVLKNYGRARRVIAVGELALLSIAEIVYFVAIGKTWRARQVVAAWRWNLSPARRLKPARAALASIRRVPERAVCAQLTRRSLRVSRYARPVLEGRALGRRQGPSRRRVHDAGAEHHLHRARGVRAAALIATLVLLVGSRSLVGGRLPVVGGFLPMPGPGTLLSDFFGGTAAAGLGTPGPATPALGLLGAASALLLGANGLLLHILVFGSVLLGAFGAARLVRPLVGPEGRLGAALGYVFVPLAWNDIARGELMGLFAFAGLPWVLVLVARTAEASERLAWQVLRLGFVLALVAAFVPAAFILEPAVSLSFGLGSLALGRAREGVRLAAAGVAGDAVAFVLCMPWSLTFLQGGSRWSALVGATSTSASAVPNLSHLLRFALGPMGGGLLAWGLVAASGLVLLIANGPRLAWGVRFWFAALASYALAWSGAEGWLGSGGGELAVLLVPAAICIAGALGLGVAAVQEDLPHAGLGWRHLAALGCSLCALAGALPLLGGALGGRWGLVGSGYESVLSWTSSPSARGAPRVPARTLWLGDPAALPLGSWQIRPGLAAGVSLAGLPRITQLWTVADPGAAGAVLSDIVEADQGRTVQLGHLLAPYGIRYLVVPTALAPRLGLAQTAPPAPPPPGLLGALDAQMDLDALPSAGGAVVFANAAWRPSSALVASGVTGPSWWLSLAVALEVTGLVAVASALVAHARRRASLRHRVPSHLRHAQPALPVGVPGEAGVTLGQERAIDTGGGGAGSLMPTSGPL